MTAKLSIAGMLTSNNQEWATPKELFDELNREFHFTLDLSANEQNAKCSKFYSLKDDALSQFPIGEHVFCNPPYGREIGKFVKKCSELSKTNKVVMLIPARTDTRYFQTYILNNGKVDPRKADVRFIDGRVKFEGRNSRGEFIKDEPATFPSCVVIFPSPDSSCATGEQ